jgi:hypothetical protein
VAVVAACSLRVQLVYLHSIEDNVDRVCNDTGSKTSQDSGC